MIKISFQHYDNVNTEDDLRAVTDIENFHFDALVASDIKAWAGLTFRHLMVDGQHVKFLSNILIWDRKKCKLWVVFAKDENDNWAFEEGTTDFNRFISYGESQFSRLVEKPIKFDLTKVKFRIQ